MNADQLAEQKEVQHASYVTSLLPIKGVGYTLAPLAEAKVAGRPAVGVKVSSKGHRDVSLYFDKATGLCVKRAHRILDSSGKEVLQEVVFSDFKDVDGVKHFQKITAFRNGQKMIEGEVTELKFFDKLEEKLFAKPE